MKNAKKILSVMLAIVTIFAMAVPVMAVENANDGTITVEGYANEDYKAYQIFKLESYANADTDDSDITVDTDAYAYTVTDTWKAFVDSVADTYFTKTLKSGSETNGDAVYYYNWKDGASAEDFAAAALDEIEKANSTITYTKEVTANSEGEAKFTELNYGWYLVDSSMGSLCSLDTTNPSATIKDKTVVVTMNKMQNENGGTAAADDISVDVVEDFFYTVTINAKKGAEGYVLHDIADEKIVIDTTSIVVKAGETTLTADSDYTLVTETNSLTDATCDFEIKFTKTYLDSLTAATDIVVTYTANLENDTAPNATYDNKAWVSFGKASATEESTVKVGTYDLKILKFTKWNPETGAYDGTQRPLADAHFTLKNAEGKYAQVTGDSTPYTLAAWVEEAQASDLVTDANGNFVVNGLDTDEYTLTETDAPDGYNLLKDPVTVTVGETVEVDTQIENMTGTEMPETGGMGTTIFYICGSALVIAAAVLLITKRLVKNAR